MDTHYTDSDLGTNLDAQTVYKTKYGLELNYLQVIVSRISR